VLRVDFGTSGIPRRLPRGSGSLPPDVVEASHRARLMNAMACVVAEKGYAATSLADLTAHAGISRTTFYEVYKDKEDCFLYCFDQCSRAHLSAVLQAAASEAVLPRKVWALLSTHLSIADSNPWFARTFIVEAQIATPATQRASESVRRALTVWLRDWFAAVRADHPAVPFRDDFDFTLVQEAVSGFVVSQVRHQRLLAPQSAALTRFVFDALGLHGWASHVTTGKADFGSPTD
jgi:AcrR family transcriptional regulator